MPGAGNMPGAGKILQHQELETFSNLKIILRELKKLTSSWKILGAGK